MGHADWGDFGTGSFGTDGDEVVWVSKDDEGWYVYPSGDALGNISGAGRRHLEPRGHPGMQLSEKSLGLGGFVHGAAAASKGLDFMDFTWPLAPNWARTAIMPWCGAKLEPPGPRKAARGILKDNKECLNK